MKNEQNNALQQGYIRRYTLTEGKENGLKVIEMDNGILRVLLNESKGLDMMQLFHSGMNISFVSKNGFTARELPFINRFEGGMLYTCGLDSFGAREGYELHGHYHNTPAKVTEIVQTDESLRVKGEIECTALFGEYLCLTRVINLPMNSDTVTITDTLENRGTKTENYCLLYHVNLGCPFLEEGVKIEGDFEEIVPRTEYASKFGNLIMSKPQDNEEERCYFLKNKGNTICASNEKLGKKFILTYSKKTLPSVVQWISPATRDYAMGLEPATSFLDDYFSYKQIQSSEKVDFSIEMQVCNTK